MSEVDDVLERLAAELAERDARIALLTGTASPGSAAPQDASGPVDLSKRGER